VSACVIRIAARESVAACFIALQRVALCCRMLQNITVCSSALCLLVLYEFLLVRALQRVAVCSIVL